MTDNTKELKFEIGSQWRTRQGTRAVIVQKYSCGSFLAWHGSTSATRGHYPKGSDDLGKSCYDLIEPWKEPRKYKLFLNVYAIGSTFGTHTYSSREEADRNPAPNRIACKEIEVTEGDGL